MPNVSSNNWGLEQIVAELRASREQLHRTRHPRGIRELPSRDAVIGIVGGLRAALFPTHYGAPDLTDESVDYYVGHTLESTLRVLADEAYFSNIWYWTTPTSSCLDGRNVKCVAYPQWTQAWTEIKG